MTTGRMTLAGLLLAAAGAANAQAGSTDSTPAYPTKPIRLVVPYPPGGSSDVVARILGQRLSEALGQPLVIDNRVGAAGILGNELVAKALPDGYTLMMGTSALAILPGLHSELRFDPVKDFAPTSLVASIPFVLVVGPSVPANSVKELIALAKAKPRQINYASSGIGSQTQLAAEQFKSMTGIDIVHVAYKGTGAATTDLISGQVHVMFTGITPLLPYLKTGRLKAVAVGSATRSALLPATPTVIESGVPGFIAETWIGVLAPSRTPAAIVTRLNRAIVKALAAPGMKERLLALGAEPISNTPDQFKAFLESDVRRWARIVKDSGVRAE